MRATSDWRVVVGAALLIGVCGTPLSAQAGDFFSNFFGALGMRRALPPPQIMLPFANSRKRGSTCPIAG